ncbi:MULTISPECIES: DUF6762 family protein [unclassified Clostridium]|uniref:Uncharacterized protein n=1 Tax=Clostridium sulfidigenes TaxID=318464 RepID=A0A927W1H3_9CLOT|nr:hypothetical protein [Clostridium sulfidigenes]
MDFSAIVLMEKDKDTKFFTRELGSYEVNEGAEYITKLFYDGEKVNLYFDTNKDVEEWEFSAIYDLFDDESFKDIVDSIEIYDEEFNPTWIVTFDYDEDHNVLNNRLNNVCTRIKEALEKVFIDIEGKCEEYQ